MFLEQIKEINPNYYDSENQIGVEYVYDKDNRKIKTIKTEDERLLYNVIYYEYDNNSNRILEKHGIDLG